MSSIYKQIDEQMNRQIDRKIDRQIDREMNRCRYDRYMYMLMNKQMNRLMKIDR